MKKIFQALLFLSFLPAFSQMSVADIFTDNMMLQRNEPIEIWGTGQPGKKVSVNFLGETSETSIKADASWLVTLKAQKAISSPKSLSIQSSGEEIILKNIIVGDVWLLIGQSNMEWPMGAEMHYDKEIGEANNSLLRFYNPDFIGKNIYGEAYNKTQMKNLAKGRFYNGKWEVSDTLSFKTMSAVGYYFGKEIVKQESVPIGLINLAIGGAPLETFIDLETLKKNKDFAAKAKGNWLKNKSLPDWVRERGRENIGNNIKNGAYTTNHAFKPGFAFKTGIKPILKMPIKGILWYQGESNAQEPERVAEYPDLQKLMIEDYRKQWGNPNLPFYWAQLSSIDTTNYDSHYWPEFRDGQRRLLNETKNTGMAVTSDIGARNDVHPRDKKTVGKRLSRWALKQAYNKDILVSGPLPKKATYKDGKIIVSFNYIGNGLEISEGNVLKGFSIDAKNNVLAKIENGKVHIKTKQKPENIYYGWKAYSDGNLVNSEGLPASTFKIPVE